MTKSIPTMLWALNLAALGLVSLTIPAAAQATDAQKNAIRSNCRSDFMSKCSSVTPGGVEAFECLKKNEASLSSACRSAVNAVNTGGAPATAKPQSAAPAPAAPTPAAPAAAATPPASEPATRSKPATASAPTTAPKSTTSPTTQKPAPKPTVAAAPPAAQDPASAPPPPPPTMAGPRLGPLQEARLVREFCTTDFRVLCKGVRLGQGRALKCLNDNQPSLSPGCRNAMQMVR